MLTLFYACRSLVKEGGGVPGEELRGLILGNAHNYVNIGLGGVRAAACVAFRVLRASLWPHVRYLVKHNKHGRFSGSCALFLVGDSSPEVYRCLSKSQKCAETSDMRGEDFTHHVVSIEVFTRNRFGLG